VLFWFGTIEFEIKKILVIGVDHEKVSVSILLPMMRVSFTS